MQQKNLMHPSLLFAVSLMVAPLILLAQSPPAGAPESSPQEAPQKQEEAATAAKSPPGNAFKWTKNITNLNLGEWFPLSFSPDGEVVKYATRKDAQRQGHIATVWFRNEFRDQQKRAGVMSYRSGVERVQFDCAGRTSRVVVQVVYSENSLGGEVKSYPSADSPWERVVPGTPGEQWIDWACNATATKKAPPLTQ
jgi:hypothetical protein